MCWKLTNQKNKDSRAQSNLSRNAIWSQSLCRIPLWKYTNKQIKAQTVIFVKHSNNKNISKSPTLSEWMKHPWHFISCDKKKKKSQIFNTKIKDVLLWKLWISVRVRVRVHARVWLKVCLAGTMAPTSLWSHILSHSLLVKSLCYFFFFFGAWSPFFFLVPINVLDILVLPEWNFHWCVHFLKCW